MDSIDLVLPWVDGSDEKWREKKFLYEMGIEKTEYNDDSRYRDYNTLQYLFRSIEKNMPWVNKIFLITDNQRPEWLKLSHPKLRVVSHDEFIPQKYLPTFNSNVIELNIFRIKELSEKFIIINDDIFFNNIINEDDFFINDHILDFGLYNRIAPVHEFAHILVNNLIIINRYFSKKESLRNGWKKQFSIRYGKKMFNNLFFLPWKDITGYVNPHMPQPHFKSTWLEVMSKEPSAFSKTYKNKFRSSEDVNHWLFRYWLIEENKYYPQSNKIGKYFLLSDTKKIKNEFFFGKSKCICINDVEASNENFAQNLIDLQVILEKKFPEKSSFEN